MKTNKDQNKIHSLMISCEGKEQVSQLNGTLDELLIQFKYDLKLGKSRDSKIEKCPKTFKELVKNLNTAYEVLGVPQRVIRVIEDYKGL